MPKKGYTPGQIINKLHEAEIQLQQGAIIGTVSKSISSLTTRGSAVIKAYSFGVDPFNELWGRKSL
jgi:hypothetical protein